jgi:hypothetical protein
MLNDIAELAKAHSTALPTSQVAALILLFLCPLAFASAAFPHLSSLFGIRFSGFYSISCFKALP